MREEFSSSSLAHTRFYNLLGSISTTALPLSPRCKCLCYRLIRRKVIRYYLVLIRWSRDVWTSKWHTIVSNSWFIHSSFALAYFHLLQFLVFLYSCTTTSSQFYNQELITYIFWNVNESNCPRLCHKVFHFMVLSSLININGILECNVHESRKKEGCNFLEDGFFNLPIDVCNLPGNWALIPQVN